MKPSSDNEIAGKVHEVKGKIKQKVGQLTNDPNLEAEGIGENISREDPKENRPGGKSRRKTMRRGTASHNRAATTLRFGSKNRPKTGGRL